MKNYEHYLEGRIDNKISYKKRFLRKGEKYPGLDNEYTIEGKCHNGYFSQDEIRKRKKLEPVKKTDKEDKKSIVKYFDTLRKR